MGGRKKLRLGRTLPKTRQGLRTPLRHTRRIPLLRLRMDHARQNLHPAQPKLRTGSSEEPLRQQFWEMVGVMSIGLPITVLLIGLTGYMVAGRAPLSLGFKDFSCT